MTEELKALSARAEEAIADKLKKIDETALINTEKVLSAFKNNRVSATHFVSSDGYGYDDRGREVIDSLYAEIFGTEAALVRHSIANGTHALAIGLFGLLRPSDILYSVTGDVYDTLQNVTNKKNGEGSLPDYGVTFEKCELIEEKGDIRIDFDALGKALKEKKNIKVVYVQRSRGYTGRRTLSADEVNEVADFVHARCDAYVFVDNCYGEFAEEKEPNRADILAGSLIKNPGGGLADCGGYFAGTKKAIELVSYRLTVPGIGGEVGATIGQNRNIIRGLFMAPHTVAQAIKTAAFAASLFTLLGYKTSPLPTEPHRDIIETIELGTAEALCAFCRGIQAGSPIDAFVSPEPWEMPGYDDPVIMAAGTFVGGSSIELSADGPLRAPYRVYLQGALTYESGKVGILTAAEHVLETKKS